MSNYIIHAQPGASDREIA